MRSSDSAAAYRILLVCLGNICRSPTAEAALREALADADLDEVVEVDSAGTGDWHIGHPPDERMVAAGRDAGLDIIGRARQIAVAADVAEHDLVLVMDRQNLADVRAFADPDDLGKIRLYREFEAGADDLEVPDPYYGGPEGFTAVVGIARAAARGVVDHVRSELGR